MNNPKSLGVIESSTVEFKTSVFYHAGTIVPSEEQIKVIVRTIASMMNMEGGTLYIGVNDKGEASSSIENEFNLLNLFPPYDKFTYTSNFDGYKRFILDWVKKSLSNFATTLLSIDDMLIDDVTICKISIKKSKVPVWFEQSSLFVRADASTRQLRGYDITSFIMQIDKEDFVKAVNDENDAFKKRLAEIKRTEKKNDRILVVYPNGEYIHYSNNRKTLFEIIHRAGIDKVQALGLTGRAGKGKTPYVPFIGNQLYLDNLNKGSKTQCELDGKLVFVKYSAGDMISKITQISNGLGLNLHIELY